MLGIKTGVYWRICWTFITPGLMMGVLLYSLISYTPLTYKGETYPIVYYAFGWLLWAVGVGQVPIWFLYEFRKQSGSSFKTVSYQF